MSDRNQLMEMGFEAERVDWALYATKNRGLQAAMDHLVENSERPVADYKSASAEAGGNGSAANGEGNTDEYDAEDQAALADMYNKNGQGAQDDMLAGVGEAKSIKCSDCGKVLKSAAFASFHAEKSGHTNFEESTEEIKPLTEEEKKQRLQEMREKLAQKRATQSKEDAQTQRENEKIRRKAGQEMGEAREEMKKKEAMREAEKKRQEKQADIEAKKRVKAQIEADKRERAEKAAREKALREGRPVESAAAAAPTQPPATSIASSAAAASTSNEARLRVRAPGGMFMGTLSADATLADLESKIQADGKAQGSLQFSTTFPRKAFSAADRTKTLRELGLVPNAALEASNA